MEFRYRSIDSDRPRTVSDTAPTQSPNPSLSFSSAQPISRSSEDHVQEAIKREIEKEQIRQEIIVAETMRRRELIAEVIQEMAIEREMALRRVAGMSLENKLTMWINQKKLLSDQIQNNNFFREDQNLMDISPYNLFTSPMMQLSPLEQIDEATEAKVTSIMESNKDKLIKLNRPDAIGGKRKAEDTQTDHVRAKRKADGVGLARDPNLVGPENKAKEIALKEKLKSMETETVETVSLKLSPCSGKLVSGKQVESKSNLDFKFWCDICGVGTHSQTVMRNHELGKKHIAAIKQQNEPPKIASTSMTITPPPQSETVAVPENADVQDQPKVDETAGNETGKKKKKARFLCELCNIETYSEQLMETHRLGKKHIAAIKQQNEPPKTDSTSTPPPQSETVAVPENADVQDQPKVDEMVVAKETGKKKKKTRFLCELCNIETYSEQLMETHRLGKKHIAAIKQQNELPKIASTSMTITTPPQSETVAVPENADVQDQPKVDETAKETGGKKKRARFMCELCNIETYSEKLMETHRLGKKHIAAIKQQNEPPKKTPSTSMTITPPPQSENVLVPENADVQDQPKVDETAGKETYKKKKKIWLWCKNCKIAATKQQNEPPKTASTSMIITPPPQSETVAVPENADVQDQPKVDVVAKETGEKKKKVKCEICNIPQYTEQMIEANWLERMHKVRLKRQQRALKKQQYEQRVMKKQQYELQAVEEDTNVITVPVISLDADSGDKVKVPLLGQADPEIYKSPQ